MEHQKNSPAGKALKVLAAVAAVLVALWLCFLAVRLALGLQEPLFREQFRGWIDSLGWRGVAVMLVIQVVQIVIAVIPGEPVELLCGVLYGTLGGLVLCEAGILIGQILVFLLVRRFGAPLVEVFFEKRHIQRFAFLQNTQRLESITFLLFFIPGTPKDILCYVAGLTKINLRRFLVISSVARIPSVVTSTLAGATLGSGQLWVSLVVFAVIGAMGLGGILWNRRVMGRLAGEEGKQTPPTS